MEQRQLYLRDILSVLFKRKWLIVLFAIAVIVIVVIANQVWPETYESDASVRILRGRQVTQIQPTAVQMTGSMAVVQMGREDVNSEIELLLSNDVLRKVVDELGLQGATGIRQLLNTIQQTVGLVEPTDAEEAAIQAAVEDLRDSISVQAVKDSYVLEISAQRNNPEQAQRVAQSLINHYRDKHVEVFSAPESLSFFDEQIARVSSDLETAQAELNEFRNTNNVISSNAERELLLEQYRDAKKLLVQLQQTASAAEGLTEDRSAADVKDDEIIAALSSQTESPVVTELQLKLLELVLRRNNISRSLGPKHPEFIAVNEEIDSAFDRLESAIDTTRRVTQAKVDEVEERLRVLNEADSELNAIEDRVDALSEAVEYYTKKSEEARVSDAMTAQKISSVAVVSSPSLPVKPISPNKLLNLLVGIIAGITGGIALAFFLEYLDHGLKTPEDVEYWLHVPCLASYFANAKKGRDEQESERLATMVDAVVPDKDAEIIQVSSATPGEGAIGVARSLATAYAENPNAKVLLVDLISTGVNGFVDVVTGAAPMADVITREGGFDYMSAGSRVEIPAYLWNSDRMRDTLRDARSKYDRVIIHTAPVLQSHDAINLSESIDGAVITVEADRTRREVVQRAIDSISSAAGRVLGVVLTNRRQVIPDAVYKRI